MTGEADILQAVLDATAESVFAVDRELRYTAFNGAHAADMRELYGAEIELGGRFPDYQTAESDRSRAEAAMGRALTGEAVVLDVVAGEGEHARRLEISHAPLRDDGGEVTGAVVRARDVTGEPTRDELEAGESRFRDLFRRSRLGVALHEMLFDGAGRPADYVYLDANPAYETLTGLPPASVLGRRATEVVPGIEGTPLIGIYGQVVLTGEAVVFDQCAASLGKHFSVSACPLGGNRFATLIEDVTARKTAERELAESHALLLSIVDETSDAVYAKDESGRYLLFNRAAEKVTGRRADEVLGKDDRSLFPADEATAIMEGDQAVMRSGSTMTYEEVLTGAQGRAATFLSTKGPLRDADGAVRGLFSIDRDVTNRKAAERALAESEARYHGLFRNMPVGYARTRLVHDDQGRPVDFEYLEANEAFTRIAGATAVVGRRVRELSPFTDAQSQQRMRGAVAVAGGGPPFHVYFELPEHGKWVGVTYFSTAPGECVSIFEDITERVQHEQKLLQTEAMRDVAEEVGLVGSWHWDLATRCSTWSRGMYRLFDVDPEGFDGDVTGILAARVHPDDKPGLDEAIARVAAESRPVPVEYRVVWRDGSEHVLHGEGTPIRDADGTPTGITGYYQDVTERRRTEQENRRLTRLYATLSEVDKVIATARSREQLFSEVCRVAVDVGGFVMAWVGLVDETGTRVTPCVSAGEVGDYLTGLEVDACDSALGRGPTGTAIRERRSVVCQDIAEDPRMDPWRERALTTGYRSSAAVPVLERGSVTGALVVFAAEPDGFSQDDEELLQGTARSISIALDNLLAVTDRERLNAGLEERVAARTRQLEDLNHELESFAYSVSHDLRAPLRAVDGFSEMVLEDAGGRLTVDDRTHLERVRSAAQRMGRLIDELLSLSRMSRQEMRVQDVDVSGLAEEVVEELRAVEPARVVHVAVQPGVRADADEALLRDILANLIGNAWKFTRQHESASIEVGVLAGDEPVFFVRDDGAGFDQAHAGRLFGAFQRMHSDQQFEGTGIGLATVQRLVARHGGRVWAEAEVEKGATFSFTLPRAAPQA